MCKLFLISIILTSSLSLSFSMNNYTCEENNYSYELKLNRYHPEVVQFVEDGWDKLVADYRTRGVTNRGDLYVQCATVQVLVTERRYTVLVRYIAFCPVKVLFCVIFAMKIQTESMSISCYEGWRGEVKSKDPADNEQYHLHSLFYNNKEFCS